ncbi:hypothetical protein ES703_57614 [subsurface metagenome]
MEKLSSIALFLSVLVLGSIVPVSCDSSPSPASSEKSSPLILEEKSLPPVFSDYDHLHGSYFRTLYFPISYSHLVFGSPPSQSDSDFAELTVNASLPDIPDKLIAYKVIRPVVDETYARNLSQRLGFNDPLQFNSTHNTYQVYRGSPSDDDSPVLLIREEGSIAIHYDRRLNIYPLSLPSNIECIDIARKWLESYDLYPQNVVSITASPYIVAMMSGSKESQHTVATSVSFNIGLDGYELFGMGAFFFIGEKGKVLEVHINAPEFEPYSYVKVQKPELALSILQDYLNNPSKFRADTPECLIRDIKRYVTIKSVSLKYFGMISPNHTQAVHAQPIYVLEGEDKDKPELPWETFTAIVDAVSR